MTATRTIIGEELRREHRRVAFVLVFVVLAGAATVAGPLLVRAAIDNGIDAGDSAALRTTAIAYLVVSIGGGIAGGMRTATMAVAAERILHRLRLRALAGVLRMDLGAYERAPRGDVVARVTSDTEALSKAAMQVLPNAAKYTLDLVAAILAVFLLSPVIGALSLIVVPPFAVAGHWFRRTSVVVYPEYRRRVGEMVGTVVETTEGAETVRTYGREAHQLAALARADERVVDGYLDGMRMRVRFFASLTFVQAAATAIVLIASSLLALNGTLSVGTVAAGVLAAVQVFVPFGEMTELLDELLASKAALDRVAEVASTPAEAERGAALPERGALELEHAGFAYVEGRPVLHDVSLRVEPGEWLALVGATGAGKSTIARLAVGLAHPSAGRVRVADVDLRAAAPADRRRRLLLLPQEGFLISGSLGDNARIADPECSDARVHEAVDALGLHDWLARLPRGLETPVGSAGVRLSQGERQLVSLVRVVLADPAVVVLDEATSVLDAKSEARVAAALERALTGRTVLVVAHRLVTAQRCDRMAVVEDGRIVA
ncbi:MAG: ABC transporter ATP-binding protein, partial [Acidimicrobiia bacterium]